MRIDCNDVTLDIMDYFKKIRVEYVDIGLVLYTKNTMNEETGWKTPYSNRNISI